MELLVVEEGLLLSRWFFPFVCAVVFWLRVRFGFRLCRGSIRLSRERVWREEEAGRVFCCAWASPFRTACLVLVVKALMNSQYEFALQFDRSACADRRRHGLKMLILRHGRIGLWYGLFNMFFRVFQAKITLPPSPQVFSACRSAVWSFTGFAVSPSGAHFEVSMLDCAERADCSVHRKLQLLIRSGSLSACYFPDCPRLFQLVPSIL